MSFFFLHLLHEYSLEALIYIAPESLVLGSLEDLAAALNNADIILTAHRTIPLSLGSTVQSEWGGLQSELYTPGLLAFRGSSTCRRMLDWWAKSVSEPSHGPSAKRSGAERWIKSVSEIFEGARFLRKPGYDTGYWNLNGRRIRMDGEKVFVNDEPAYLFNFYGFDLNKGSESPSLQSCDRVNDMGEVTHLFSRYYDLLLKSGWHETSRWTYTYDFFRCGPKIPASARSYYRSLGVYANELGDPFTWIDDSELGHDKKAATLGSENELPFGVNVIGSLRSEKGVGEMARSSLRVLTAARIPFVANDFVDPSSENVEECPTHIAAGNPYRANIVTVNADTLPYFARNHPHYMRHRFNIGYWAWELPDFPSEWATSFGYLDEVWTLSRFARNSIASSSRVPVRVVHCSLDLESVSGPSLDRASFEIPDGMFLFLFMFDFHSVMERKNPLGLIRAFKAAFGARMDVQLVIKCSHSQEYPTEARILKDAAAGTNIHVLDGVYSRVAKNGLMQLADCYVSLHRSEGFGLTLAEAMFCGKPVIATGYSGNMDFMSGETGFLVPYRIAATDRAYGPYKAASRWADPDLDYAVDVFRYVEKNRELAAEVGRRGRSSVSTFLHPATIGRSVADRFQELGLLT
jgi:glycosyltransferase involved in cell wall biosynthesis